MGIPKLSPKISIEDYLEGEKISQVKHEYVDGEVFAMDGTSKSHNRIIRVEVLSLSTALTDRREKMFIYKEIETVEEYVLIEQDKMYAEIYRRRESSGLWDWIEFFPEEEIEFASVGFKMSMEKIYDGVKLPEKKFHE